MKTVQHTPGPWTAKHNRFGLWRVCRGAQVVADNISDNSERTTEANAHLIAAAPDLLAALEAIIATIDGGGDPTHGQAQKARAAIAKAKGAES